MGTVGHGRGSQNDSTSWQTYSHDPHSADHIRLRITIWGIDGTNGLVGHAKSLEARLVIVEQAITLAKWLALLILVGMTLSEKRTLAEVVVHVLKTVASVS